MSVAVCMAIKSQNIRYTCFTNNKRDLELARDIEQIMGF